MAKFGYLYLHKGQWDGQQIVPAEYAQASLGKQIETPWPDTVYGYQWWRVDSINVSFALGYAKQMIVVVPDKAMIVVITGSMTENIGTGLLAYPLLFTTAQLSTSDAALPENAEAFNALTAFLGQRYAI